MSILKKIAAHAVTVEVSGEEVHLRYPTVAEKIEIINMLPGEGATTGEHAAATHDMTVQSLVTCVTGDHSMTGEEWARLIMVSNDCPDEYAGLPALVARAMKMCGLNAMVQAGKVRDDMADLDEVIGEDPT